MSSRPVWPLAASPGGQRGGARLAVVAVLLAVGAGAAFAWTRHVPPDGDYRLAMAAGRYERAALWLRAAADEGDPGAQTALGNLHYLGLGVEQDPRRAAELYYAAAGRGHGAAQLNLGHLYSQGLGVPRDGLRAFGWYHHADVAGEPAAEYYLYQIGTEWTLSPLQRATAVERWRRLDALVAEGL